MTIAPYSRLVHYYETDQMGIVHHSNYIRWFEEARMDYARQAGISYAQMETDGVYMPVLAVSCRYHQPVRFDETVTIVTKLVSLSGVRAAYRYEIYGADPKKPAVTGETEHCFVDKTTGWPLNLKKESPAVYEAQRRLLDGAERKETP